MDAQQYGWPISVPVKIIGSKVFIEARRGLTPYPYGYFNEKQCKRGVFKQLEQFLKHYGLQDTDIYMDKTCKDYISAEAFILALIAGIKLRDPTRNQIQSAWKGKPGCWNSQHNHMHNCNHIYAKHSSLC